METAAGETETVEESSTVVDETEEVVESSTDVVTEAATGAEETVADEVVETEIGEALAETGTEYGTEENTATDETEVSETPAETGTEYGTEEIVTDEDGTETSETELDNAAATSGLSGGAYWSYNEATETLTIMKNGKSDGKMLNYTKDSPAPYLIYTISKIKVEDGVKSIGSYAFNGCGVYDVMLSGTVESIGEAAFQNCEKLIDINIPYGIKTIGDYAFMEDNHLKNVELPDSVIGIGKKAFQGCLIEKIKIPSNVVKLSEFIFNSCQNLTNVELPDNLEIIDWGAFAGCAKLGDIVIPNKVREIRMYAFDGCTSLTDVKLPDSLIEIGFWAFQNCTSLKTVKIPENVASIGLDAFANCSSDLTLFVYKDSVGLEYAKKNSLKYKIIETIITLEDLELNEGETKKLTIKLEPEDAAYPDITWSSSNPNVASVENGTVTGKQKGTSTITAAYNGNKATCTVTVTERKTVLDVYADPPSGSKVAAGTRIELKCDTVGAKIYYTENGSDPATSGQLYKDKIAINADTTIKAVAKKEGCADSNVTELKFYVAATENPNPSQVSKVYANYTSGASISAGTKISLYCDTEGAVIYYTLDNREPTINSTRYTGAITVEKDIVIKAIAVKDGYEDSEVAELKFYVIGTENPNPGQVAKVYASYMSGQTVPAGTGISLYCDTEDATIYYTLDNSEPTTNSAHYTGEITISKDTVIKAFAVKAGYENSEVSVFRYYVNDEPVEEDEVLPGDIPSTGVPSGMWVAAVKDQSYTGTAIKPAVHVYEGRKRLEEKKDYTLSYKKNINKGTAEIVITGKGNYKDKQSAFFNITIKNINDSDVIFDDMAFVYNGKPHKAVPTITYNGKKLKLDKDFKVDYGSGDYTQQGTYYATVTGIGNFIGTYSQVKTVILDKEHMVSKASIVKPSSKEYNDGKEVTLSTDELKVVIGGILTKDKDYEVSYVNNVNPGTATAIIKGIGAYGGTKQVKFKIVQKPIDIALATVSYENSMNFTKGGCMPEPKVTYKGERLRKGTDYTVSYSKNKKVGNAVFIIKGKGKFTKSKSFTFVINQKSIEDVRVRVPDVIYAEKANAYQSKPVLTDSDGKVLAAGTDYTIQGYSVYGTPLDKTSKPYMGSIITVKLSGKGNYRGDISATYTLKSGISISKAKISVHDKTYTGRQVTLSGSDFKNASIKIGKNEANLIYGRDYTIVPGSYDNNIRKGTASVVIRGMGQYTGDKTVKFRITSKKIFF